MRSCIVTFFAVLLLSSELLASLDPTTGAQMSVAAAQDLLVSPPLPRLEAGGKWQISPQVGYMTATSSSALAKGTSNAGSGSYNGKLNGFSAGLGVTSPTSGRTGFFAFLVGSSITGKIDIYDNTGSLATTLNNMRSTVVAGTAGMNYRFIGESNSPVSMGFFLGPTFMSINSSFEAIATGGSLSATYAMNPNTYGVYSGLQGKVTVGKLIINPYVLYMKELSDSCKKLETSQAGSIAGCSSDPSKLGSIDLSTTFSGFGLFLGYKALRFNVYSKAIRDSSYSDILISNYSISYSFGADQFL